jgi:hypothetical protein
MEYLIFIVLVAGMFALFKVRVDQHNEQAKKNT